MFNIETLVCDVNNYFISPVYFCILYSLLHTSVYFCALQDTSTYLRYSFHINECDVVCTQPLAKIDMVPHSKLL